MDQHDLDFARSVHKKLDALNDRLLWIAAGVGFLVLIAVAQRFL